jgi:SAM-dependent methyltransferase
VHAVQLTPPSGDVYYGDRYWNELELVQRYMNHHSTGDPDVRWWQHLAAWRGRPFRKALAINCGNGWVERDLITYGVAESAIGIDITQSFLDEAAGAAAAAGLPIEYRNVDINSFDFDIEGVDLVINHAAAHHIAHIDRAFRQLARMIDDDGVFVSYDYVGPHRNLYPSEHWVAMHAANEQLAPEFRQRLRHAHLPTMLHMDPTEAIHSELIMPTMRRYFDLTHEAYLGGAVAYEILSRNPAFHSPDRDVSAETMAVLDADAAYRALSPEANSLFTYTIATPNRIDHDPEQLARWTAEEVAREARAVQPGSRYYPPSFVETLFNEIYELEEQLRIARAQISAGPESMTGRVRRGVADRVRRR